MDTDDRSPLRSARRLVVKVGTRILTGRDRELELARLEQICRQLATARERGLEVLLVTSGAVGLGARALGFESPPPNLEDRQACAAVGQSRLMHHYDRLLGELGIVIGQVLLTEADFDDRDRYLNVRSTLSTLLRRGVLPIINENDVVSVSELAFVGDDGGRIFGDNDHLSSLVAAKLDADLLLMLTDVEGVFDRDPRAPGATVLSLHSGDRELELARDPGAGSADSWGRGGIRSKVRAADLAAGSGCHAVVAPGYEERVVERVLDGEVIGTWFPARGRVDARRRWIAHAARPHGVLVIDEGAVAALAGGASLLAAGVTDVEGEFARGDVVELRSMAGRVIGRGMIYCDSATARRWRAGERPVEARNHHALVHRDHMALEEWVRESVP